MGKHRLAMELIEDVTFKRFVDGPPPQALAAAEAVALAVGLLRGLYEAHAARAADGQLYGVVHRDVSPQNAMVDVRGLVKAAPATAGYRRAVEPRTDPALKRGCVPGRHLRLRLWRS
jgi:hypothetical protein